MLFRVVLCEAGLVWHSPVPPWCRHALGPIGKRHGEALFFAPRRMAGELFESPFRALSGCRASAAPFTVKNMVDAGRSRKGQLGTSLPVADERCVCPDTVKKTPPALPAKGGLPRGGAGRKPGGGARHLPTRGATVAVVLRGSYGNDGRGWCPLCKGDASVLLREVLVAARSLVGMVCQPLLRRGVRVRVLSAMPSAVNGSVVEAVAEMLRHGCGAEAPVGAEAAAGAEAEVVHIERFDSADQGAAFRHSMTLVARAAAQQAALSPQRGSQQQSSQQGAPPTHFGAAFQLVIFTRHDLAFKRPIDQWDADFWKVNFYHHCEAKVVPTGALLFLPPPLVTISLGALLYPGLLS